MLRNVLRASGSVTLASGALQIGLLLLLLLLLLLIKMCFLCSLSEQHATFFKLKDANSVFLFLPDNTGAPTSGKAIAYFLCNSFQRLI